LGIRKIVDHGPVAFFDSWNRSLTQSHESWLNVDSVPENAPHQRPASAEVDRAILDLLTAKGSPRDQQRLKRLNCEHANSWITALPSATDGKDTIMSPKIFRGGPPAWPPCLLETLSLSSLPANHGYFG